MKVCYIAGKYRAKTPRGIVENIRAAEAVALKYWKQGHAVICPHMNSALFDGALPDEVWMDGDLAILERCHTIVMMQGWQESDGARREHEMALGLRLEIIYD